MRTMPGEERSEVEVLRARVAELEAQLAREREHAALSQQLVERAPIAIQCYDADGYTNLMNGAMQRLIGLPDRESVYGRFNVLEDEQMRAQGISALFERAYSGELVEVPEVKVDFAGFDEGYGHQQRATHWLHEVIFPLMDDGGGVQGTACFMWDVTRRRETEEALLAAQRHQHLALLAGGVAHDFNNLLTVILGLASLGLLETDRARMQRCFEDLQHAAEQASTLTRQLLAYAGKGRFVVRPVDVAQMVRDMRRLLGVILPSNVALRIDVEEGGVVNADETQLHQTVMNVVRNAIEAIGDEPGTVTVATSTVDADDSYLATALGANELVAGRYVCVEISDTGCGMDDETLGNIFDPFFTRKDRGHGLGLSATLGIVRSHGGAIRVYSELGRGTTIKILLPAGEGDAAEPKTLPVDPVPVLRKRRVLVVDDEPMIVNVVQQIFNTLGWDVLTASNGAEAVAKYDAHDEHIDLVLLDMTMPVMGGAEAFRELRRIDPGVRVLLTSGYNEQDTTSRFAGKGLAGFLQKPYRASAVVEKLKQLFPAEEE
ncbi:MAG: response regulator [Myxococcales bacterium]|nr:response regulator [Myxococcales bacterium]